MAEAIVTLKLTPGEFKLVQSALMVAEQESLAAANNAENARNKHAFRAESVLFAELHAKLTR